MASVGHPALPERMCAIPGRRINPMGSPSLTHARNFDTIRLKHVLCPRRRSVCTIRPSERMNVLLSSRFTQIGDLAAILDVTSIGRGAGLRWAQMARQFLAAIAGVRLLRPARPRRVTVPNHLCFSHDLPRCPRLVACYVSRKASTFDDPEPGSRASPAAGVFFPPARAVRPAYQFQLGSLNFLCSMLSAKVVRLAQFTSLFAPHAAAASASDS